MSKLPVTFKVQRNLATFHLSQDDGIWVALCSKKKLEKLLNKHLHPKEMVETELYLAEKGENKNQLKVEIKIEDQVALMFSDDDTKEWIATCCKDGIEYLLEKKLFSGNKIKTNLFATETKTYFKGRIKMDKNKRVNIQGEVKLSVKNLDGSEFLPETKIPISHPDTPVSTLNAIQRALASALVSLADQSDLALYGTTPKLASATVVNEDGSTSVVDDGASNPDDGTHLYKVNFGVVKKISALVWKCSNKGTNTAPIGSIDGGLYQLLPSLAGAYLIVRFDASTPPSFATNDPPTKPVNFTVELWNSGVIVDTVAMSGTRVKGGFGLAGGDSDATQSIAVTPTTTASCQVTLRF